MAKTVRKDNSNEALVAKNILLREKIDVIQRPKITIELVVPTMISFLVVITTIGFLAGFPFVYEFMFSGIEFLPTFGKLSTGLYGFSKFYTLFAFAGSLVFGYMWLKIHLENQFNQNIDKLEKEHGDNIFDAI